MKTCTKCKKSKELSDFHKYKPARDGHTARCKDCKNAAKPCVWSESKVRAVARRCKTRTEFIEKYSGAYEFAKRWGFFDDAVEHMVRLGNKYNKFLYAYLFTETGEAYVGLTDNKHRRHAQHMYNNTPTGQAVNNCEYFEYVELMETMPAAEAAGQEGVWYDHYKGQGWNMLNLMATGSLGGSDEGYTDAELRKIAAKYTTIKAFKKDHNATYAVICRRRQKGRLQDIYDHIDRLHMHRTDAELRKIAAKYSTKAALAKDHPGPYSTIGTRRKEGRLQDIYDHMDNTRRRRTDDELYELAAKYSTKATLAKDHPAPHSTIGRRRKEGRLQDIYDHMDSICPRRTDDELYELAAKYTTINA